jgi:hypothetical protein
MTEKDIKSVKGRFNQPIPKQLEGVDGRLSHL